MKIFVGLLLASFIHTLAFAQAPALVWAKATQGSQQSAASTVVSDPKGNLYIGGSFSGTTDFNPGSATHNLTSNGKYDCYIMKLDSAGKFLWARSFGGIENDMILQIETDRNGNVYAVGRFSDTVDFNPGTSVYKLNTFRNYVNDGFITKLDSNGVFQWAHSTGGQPSDNSFSVEVDVYENVYVTGFFQNTADFDPGAGVFNLSSEGVEDIFLLKLKKDGSFFWAKRIGGISRDICFSMTSDNSGFLYLTGSFSDTVDFDPNTGVYPLVAEGNMSAFVQKLDPSGGFVWAKTFGGIGATSLDIHLDINQNVLITGYYSYTSDFDPGPGVYNLPGLGPLNMFIVKLDNSGVFKWANGMEAVGQGVSSDVEGNVYAIGDFADTSDFDPGTDTLDFIASGIRDVIVQKLDSNGALLWARSIGDTGYDGGASITIDRNGDIYGCGIFYSPIVDFDPNSGVYNLTNNCIHESYIFKWRQCASLTIDKRTACDSLVWINGKTYLSDNNTAIENYVNSEGCDSSVTLNLRVNYSTEALDQLKACGSIKWIDGNTYSTSNNSAQHRLINNAGCDSVVTLDLIVGKNTRSTQAVTECDRYKWIDGKVYYEDNQLAQHILVNEEGCDSLVSLDLKIRTVDDFQVFQNDSSITIDMENVEIQWFTCEEKLEMISDEKEQEFIAKTNGSFAVQVEQNGCLDTSNCISVNSYVIPEYRPFSCTSIFPNPCNNSFDIEFGNSTNNSFKLYSMDGKIVGFGEKIASPIFKVSFDLPSATYLLLINTEQGTHQCKLEVN